MELNINGGRKQVDADPAMPLLWVLRDLLNMTGTRFGRGVAACGACTVRIGGQACGLASRRSAASPARPSRPRRSLLEGSPRPLAVLDLAAARAGWGARPPAGRARGHRIARVVRLHRGRGAEVSLEAGLPRVHRVVCAIGCGVAVNPGIVAQQMESAVVFALTAALHGRVDIHDRVVQQENFPSYPIPWSSSHRRRRWKPG